MAAPVQDDSVGGAQRRTVAEARGRLRAAQKRDSSVPAYLRWVNRPLGGQIAAVAWAWGLRPNHITAISAAFSAAAIALLALVAPSPALGFAVAALLLVGYAFDSADGQLARLQGGGSPAGEWLDHVTDAGRNLLLHSAVAVSLYRFTSVEPVVLLLPLTYLVVSGTFFFALMLRDQLRRSSGAPKPAPGGGSSLTSVLLVPVDYASLCLAFVLLGWTTAFLVAYAALLLVTALFAARALPKAFRELGAAADSPA